MGRLRLLVEEFLHDGDKHSAAAIEHILIHVELGLSLIHILGWDCVAFAPFSYNGIQALVKGGDTQYYHAGLVVLPEYHMAAAVLRCV